MNTTTLTNLMYAGSFAVDSGQAMVGDPGYLSGWDTNEGDEWNLEGKKGQYSYHGVSAITLENNFGQVGSADAVAFSTGYGDGLYPVYVQVNSDGRVCKVVIDFEGDIDEN